MELKALEIKQHDNKFYLVNLKAKDLIDEDKIQVDYWRKENQEGYQRTPTASRARAFSAFIKNKKSASPVSVLLSIRGTVNFTRETSEGYGTLRIPQSANLWIVDGQHRIEGLKNLSQKDSAYQDFEIPTIIFPLKDRYEEAKQFFIINRTQKGVKADLAERFLSELAKKEGIEVLSDLPYSITRGIDWIPKAIKIADVLNDKDGCWHNRIRFPNETKKTSPASIVSQKAFTNSLEDILTNSLYADYNETEIAEMISRYWEAVKELCPEPFKNPSEYVIQRTTGVAVLNKIFTSVVAFSIDGKEKCLTKDRLKKVLSAVKKGMSSEYWHVNGTAGIAGTSKKSFSILTNQLRDELNKGNSEKRPQLTRPFDL